MALVKADLKNDLKAAFQLARSAAGDEEAGLDTFCDAMATAFDNYIKSAQINYTSGLVAPSGGGAVTGTITHTIS